MFILFLKTVTFKVTHKVIYIIYLQSDNESIETSQSYVQPEGLKARKDLKNNFYVNNSGLSRRFIFKIFLHRNSLIQFNVTV